MMLEYDVEGTIAGYIVAEPFGTMVVNKGLGDVLKLSKEIMPNHACCAVIAREAVLQESPDAVQELVNSLVHSGLLVGNQKEVAVKLGSGFLNQEESVVRAILTDPNERVSTDKLMPNLEELEYMQTYLTETVSIPSLSAKIDVNAFVDLTYAKAAGAK